MDESLLTEANIRALVEERIFQRGDAYCEQGAVLELARRGSVLHAAVAGSRPDPYHVQVTTRGDRIVARCDCPYAEEWDECCKHIVAVMLALVRQRGPVEAQPTVRELLAPLDRATMQRLVEGLVERAPWSYDIVRAGAERQRRRTRPAERADSGAPADREP